MNDSVGKHNKRQRNFSQSVIIRYNVGLIRKIIILLYHREKKSPKRTYSKLLEHVRMQIP